MERRFAVLWEPDGPVSREVGLVVERDDHVLVDVSDRYCIPPRQRGEFKVGAPDGTLVTYRPGDEGYFDQVLIALASTFAIGEHGMIDERTTSVPELYMERVTNATIAKQRRSYPSEDAEAPFKPSIPAASSGRSRRALLVA